MGFSGRVVAHYYMGTALGVGRKGHGRARDLKAGLWIAPNGREGRGSLPGYPAGNVRFGPLHGHGAISCRQGCNRHPFLNTSPRHDWNHFPASPDFPGITHEVVGRTWERMPRADSTKTARMRPRRGREGERIIINKNKESQ